MIFFLLCLYFAQFLYESFLISQYFSCYIRKYIWWFLTLQVTSIKRAFYGIYFFDRFLCSVAFVSLHKLKTCGHATTHTYPIPTRSFLCDTWSTHAMKFSIGNDNVHTTKLDILVSMPKHTFSLELIWF